jgi:iron complex transport system permease protein
MHPRRATLALAAACVALAGLSLLVGHGDLGDAVLRDTFLGLRAWRAAAALLSGAALAVAGVLVQGCFHNPLASPDVLGTTAGATLGGQAALLGWGLVSARAAQAGLAPDLVVPLGSLAGAWIALGLVSAAARWVRDPLGLLLTGVLVSTVAVSIGGLFSSLAMETWEVGRALLAFTLGGVDGAGPARVLAAAPWLFGGLLAAGSLARPLDVLLSGDEEAQALGVDVRRTRRWAVAWVAALAAAATFVGGQVPFVGLVVPHVVRRWTGPSHARLIPAAALGGGAFVLACDLAVRMVPARGAVPLGAVTGLVGAPVFVMLLARRGRAG